MKVILKHIKHGKSFIMVVNNLNFDSYHCIIREHRRYVIEILNNCDDEIEFLEENILEEDNKNYHGWGYR